MRHFYHKIVYLFLGLVFIIHYTTLIFSSPKVKYNLVKYQLFRSDIEKHLSIIIERPEEELKQNVQYLRDKLKNQYHMDFSVPIKIDECQSDRVCNEIYLGNLADYPWHEKVIQLIYLVLCQNSKISYAAPPET